MTLLRIINTKSQNLKLMIYKLSQSLILLITRQYWTCLFQEMILCLKWLLKSWIKWKGTFYKKLDPWKSLWLTITKITISKVLIWNIPIKIISNRTNNSHKNIMLNKNKMTLWHKNYHNIVMKTSSLMRTKMLNKNRKMY